MAQINQELLGRIMLKLDVGESRAYKVVKEKANETLLPRHLAAILVASENGINVNKYATADELAEVRTAANQVQPQIAPSATPTKKTTPKKPPPPPQVSSLIANDPFLSSRDLTAAGTNADLYPTLYAFENSIRKFVVKMMVKHFGKNWWTTRVKVKLQERVRDRRRAEKQYPWHSRRRPDPIYYTDISDLEYIIRKHEQQFRAVLGPNFGAVQVWIGTIERTRHILAHNNPVQKRDRERLILHAEDWSKVAQAIVGQVV